MTSNTELLLRNKASDGFPSKGYIDILLEVNTKPTVTVYLWKLLQTLFEICVFITKLKVHEENNNHEAFAGETQKKVLEMSN